MCSYGRECIETVKNGGSLREGMNAVFAANRPPNVEEREDMIKRAKE